MSKSDLKKYLKGLKKAQLEDQIMDLYERFKPVKTYYDFAFNPKEDKLIEEAKFKIGKEYFPQNNRNAKLRRSIAQKLIRHFQTLGMAPSLLLDLMLFNIEIAQAYTSEKAIKQESFYKSMFQSFQSALEFADNSGQFMEFSQRIKAIGDKAVSLDWQNSYAFLEAYEYVLLKSE